MLQNRVVSWVREQREVKDECGGQIKNIQHDSLEAAGRVTISPDLSGAVRFLPVIQVRELLLPLFLLKYPALNTTLYSHIGYRLNPAASLFKWR